MTTSDKAEGEPIPPLRKRTADDGALYTRPKDVEELIAGILRLPEEEALARAAISRRRAPGWLRGEALVFMMRRAARLGDRRAYNRWCQLVLDRIRRQLPHSRSEDAATTVEAELADYGLNRFAMLLGPDLDSYNESLDIYEARFDLAVANLRRDALRCTLPAEDEPEEVALGEDPRLDHEAELAQHGKDLFGLAASNEEDFRSRVWDAIDALPMEQKRTLTMTGEGMAVKDIAAALGRTTRTVSTWKLAAYEAVRNAVEGNRP
jgi:hypothetical protein